MQRLEVSGALRPIYGSLGVKRLIPLSTYLKVHTLCDKSRQLDAVFLISVYNGLKFCPSLLEIVRIRVHTTNLRRFTLMMALNVAAVLDARASAANAVCGDAALLRKNSILLKDILI